MKKILLIVLILLVTCLSCVICISLNRKIDLDYFVIKENKSYVYRDNNKLNFEIYTYKPKSLITFKEENDYVLIYDNDKVILNDVEVYEYKQNDIYVIKILSIIPEVFKNGICINDLRLEISNSNYEFIANMGTLSIINPNDFELLSIQELYASYSYINSCLMLVGINITLTNNYERINKVSIGNYINGILCLSLKDTRLDNEIEIKKILPSYDVKFKNEENLKLESKTYFIPLSYDEFNVTKEGYIILNIDDKNYYLDTFSFISNDLIFEDYKNICKKGNINYA